MSLAVRILILAVIFGAVFVLAWFSEAIDKELGKPQAPPKLPEPDRPPLNFAFIGWLSLVAGAVSVYFLARAVMSP